MFASTASSSQQLSAPARLAQLTYTLCECCCERAECAGAVGSGTSCRGMKMADIGGVLPVYLALCLAVGLPVPSRAQHHGLRLSTEVRYKVLDDSMALVRALRMSVCSTCWRNRNAMRPCGCNCHSQYASALMSASRLLNNTAGYSEVEVAAAHYRRTFRARSVDTSPSTGLVCHASAVPDTGSLKHVFILHAMHRRGSQLSACLLMWACSPCVMRAMPTT